jgi:hypothetical protein
MFDGPLYRLLSYSESKSRLQLSLGRTSYKEYVGTNLAHPEWGHLYGSQFLANPLAFSVVVTTSDNMIVLGERPCGTHKNSRIHVAPAGHLVPPLRNGEPDYTCQPSIANQIMRELTEELGSIKVDQNSLVPTGFIRTCENNKPELTFQISALVECKEVLSMWERAPDAWEHSRLFSIQHEPNTLRTFLFRNFRRMCPPGHAALLLLGHANFGKEWFSETISRLGTRIQKKADADTNYR